MRRLCRRYVPVYDFARISSCTRTERGSRRRSSPWCSSKRRTFRPRPIPAVFGYERPVHQKMSNICVIPVALDVLSWRHRAAPSFEDRPLPHSAFVGGATVAQKWFTCRRPSRWPDAGAGLTSPRRVAGFFRREAKQRKRVRFRQKLGCGLRIEPALRRPDTDAVLEGRSRSASETASRGLRQSERQPRLSKRKTRSRSSRPIATRKTGEVARAAPQHGFEATFEGRRRCYYDHEETWKRALRPRKYRASEANKIKSRVSRELSVALTR